jgi:hypothetical protein
MASRPSRDSPGQSLRIRIVGMSYILIVCEIDDRDERRGKISQKGEEISIPTTEASRNGAKKALQDSHSGDSQSIKKYGREGSEIHSASQTLSGHPKPALAC